MTVAVAEPKANGNPPTSASQALGAQGAGELFDSLGETWSLTTITQNMKSEYEAWAILDSRRALARRKKSLDPEDENYAQDYADYQEDLGRLEDAINAGDYNWGWKGSGLKIIGDAIANKIKSPQGRVKLTQILLFPKHGKLSVEKVLEIVAGADPDLFQPALAAAMEGRLPNGPAPGVERLPGAWAKWVRVETVEETPEPEQSNKQPSTE